MDIRIVGVLLGGDPASPSFRPPFRGVARTLGIDEGTVRTRLEKLRASGFLKGWLVAVNPTLLGQHVARVWLDAGRATSKSDVLQQLALVDGMSLVLDYFGTAIGLHLYYADQRELERRAALIARIATAPRIECREMPYPRSTSRMSRLDWRIVRSVQRDPWKPYVSVAREAGASSATVRRRLARLNRSRALFLLAEIDPRRATGSLLAHLFVFYAPESDRSQVDRAIAEHVAEELAFAELDEPDLGFFALRLANLSRVNSLRTWVERLPGVHRTKLELLADMVPCPMAHESIVERGLKEADGRGSARVTSSA